MDVAFASDCEAVVGLNPLVVSEEHAASALLARMEGRCRTATHSMFFCCRMQNDFELATVQPVVAVLSALE